MITCRACGFQADGPGNFDIAISVYNDIRCPKCGSTNNQHNSEYQDRLFESMKKTHDKRKENKDVDI